MTPGAHAKPKFVFAQAGSAGSASPRRSQLTRSFEWMTGMFVVPPFVE
jgi:hypothetical protein